MRTYKLTVEGQTCTIKVKRFSREEAELEVNGDPVTVRIDDIESDNGPRRIRSVPTKPPPREGPKPYGDARPTPAAGAGSVTAPIPGLIMEIFVKQGDDVASGAPVLKMEAMKMETVVNASAGGTVQIIHVNEGDNVTQGQALLTIS